MAIHYTHEAVRIAARSERLPIRWALAVWLALGVGGWTAVYLCAELLTARL